MSVYNKSAEVKLLALAVDSLCWESLYAVEVIYSCTVYPPFGFFCGSSRSCSCSRRGSCGHIGICLGAAQNSYIVGEFYIEAGIEAVIIAYGAVIAHCIITCRELVETAAAYAVTVFVSNMELTDIKVSFTVFSAAAVVRGI